MSDLGIVVVCVLYVQQCRHGVVMATLLVYLCVCARVSWHLCHVGRQSFTGAANYVGLCVSLFLIVRMCYMYVYTIV